VYLYSGGAWFESRVGQQLADVRVLTQSLQANCGMAGVHKLWSLGHPGD